MSVGKTRPELPTKVEMPRDSAQARTAGPSKTPKALNKDAGNWSVELADELADVLADKEEGAFPARYRLRNGDSGSLWVKFNPPLPASKNLRPTEGMASKTTTCCPACDSTSAAINPAGPAPITKIGGFERFVTFFTFVALGIKENLVSVKIMPLYR